MITKDLLLDISKLKGLKNKEHIEKDYFQDLFLSYIYKKTNKLIFKGGTALYKLYKLQRFSEDLDFSIIESIDAENLIKDIIHDKNDFKIKSIKSTNDSTLIKISCKGILTKENSIRIDINFKNKVLRDFDIKDYVSDYVDINPFVLRSLKPEEIISEKIHSLLNRERARDLYDLFFLLKFNKFDKSLVTDKLKLFNIKYDKKVLENNINNLESLWEKELKSFVLKELPDFSSVKSYVLNKISY